MRRSSFFPQRGVRRSTAIDPMPPTLATATPTIDNGHLRLDFDMPVIAESLPVLVTMNGAAPTSFTQTSKTRITLTYAVPVAQGQTMVIPNFMPQIRNRGGGYVASATHTF